MKAIFNTLRRSWVMGLVLVLANGIVQAAQGVSDTTNTLPETADTAFTISPAISGSWYDPTQSGHGFVLEVQDGNRLNAYWFTYDGVGNQAWMVGSGDIEGNTATVPVDITRGGVFSPDFDPNAVVRQGWGSLLFTFDSCHSGSVTYNVGFGSGTLPLQRLSTHEGLACDGNATASPTGSLKGIGGSWYNVAQSGHGLVLEAMPGDQLNVYWFAYDDVGNQAWMVGSGDIEGNTATVPVFITRGGVFGPGFDPDTVIREDWGTLVFTFEGCGGGNVAYNVGFGSGSLALQRLTAHQSLACDIVTLPCVDVAGLWNATEQIAASCVIDGETLGDSISGSNQITLRQEGCNISYRAPFDMDRNGIVTGDHVQLSGPFVFPLVSGANFTKNIATLEGTVTGDHIALSGSGQASGRFQGLAFTCTGTSTASLTRLSTTPPEPVFDGVWTGTAISSTPTDAYGDICGSASLRFEVEDNILSGTANATTGERYTVGASITTTGAVNGGFAFDGEDFVSFSGRFSGNSASGNWQDVWGCRGTWEVSRTGN